MITRSSIELLQDQLMAYFGNSSDEAAIAELSADILNYPETKRVFEVILPCVITDTAFDCVDLVEHYANRQAHGSQTEARTWLRGLHDQLFPRTTCGSVLPDTPLTEGLMSRKLHWGAWAMLVVLVAAAATTAFIIWSPTLSLQRWCQRASDALRASVDHAPEGVSPERWKTVLSWTDRAIGNCLCHPSYIRDWKRMKQFEQESRIRFHAPVTLETISWFWDGVEAVSNNGKDYAERYRPYPYSFYVERSKGPCMATDAVNCLGDLPAAASNVQYVTSTILPDLGYMVAYRFDASEADCATHAKGIIERNNRYLPESNRVSFAPLPLPGKVPVLLPPYAQYGLECQQWFDPETVTTGYWGVLTDETNDVIVIDVGRGRCYRWEAL